VGLDVQRGQRFDRRVPGAGHMAESFEMVGRRARLVEDLAPEGGEELCLMDQVVLKGE
jgi:hypothetical protein